MANHRDMRTSIEQPIRSGTSDSILASMFRHILASNNVTNEAFNSHLEKYIIRSGIPRDLKELSSLRGNLKKELTKNTMSWRVFVKALRFFNIHKFELVIRIHSQVKNGNPIEYSRMVNLDPNEVLDFSKEEPEEK